MSFRFGCIALVCAGVVLVMAGTGCHRGFYRRQADSEAQALIVQKACDPRWNLQDTTITVDPQSRMFDPFSLDHPPIPPDDPTSHQLMQRVDGKAGYRHWHANGDTSHVENPEWINYLPINEKGEVELDLRTAVDLALLHSPEYQQQQETLYLSALDVSIERFGFDAQLFSGFNSFFNTQGRLATGGSSSTFSTNTGSRGWDLQKLGVTGSTFVAGLANTLLWQFAGPNTQAATTLLDFSFIQPLLRNGGRNVVMENLTQAERTLLANVRQLERYRRGFYLQVAIGRNPGAGPNRGGNFLGNPGNANFNAGGYFGLLQEQQEIRIQEYNVYSLKGVLEQLQQFREAERIDSLQVVQAQTQLYSEQNRLISQQIAYQSSLDNFKIALGLPPDLPVVIEDPLLDQFELIDDENNERQRQVDELKTSIGDQLIRISAVLDRNKFDLPEQDGVAGLPGSDEEGIGRYGLKWNDEVREAINSAGPLLKKIKPIVEKLQGADVERIRADFDKLGEIREQRIADLKDLRKLILRNSGSDRLGIDPATLADAGKDEPFDAEAVAAESDVAILERVEELEKLLAGLIDKEITRVVQNLDRIETLSAELAEQEDVDESNPAAAQALFEKVKEGLVDYIPQLLTDVGGVSLELGLLQARARTDTIALTKVNLSAEAAIRIAREFRRDWMNARANLVDQWRQIEIAANDLESTLDVVVDGSVGNFGSNPFSIRAETATLRAGLQFDAPIVRQSERNLYRQRLIEYQQTKRQYYQFEDAIKFNLRNIVRQIAQRRILFETNRRDIKASIRGLNLPGWHWRILVTFSRSDGSTPSVRQPRVTWWERLPVCRELKAVFSTTG